MLLSPLAPAAAGRADLDRGGAGRPAVPELVRAAARPSSVLRSTRTRAAALSPGGRWLAVVELDATVAAPEPVLVVLDPATGTCSRASPIRRCRRGRRTARRWPSRGRGRCRSSTRRRGRSDEPSGRAIRWWRRRSWSPLGEQLVLDVAGPTDLEHLELADSVVLARYAVPGVAGASSDPVISPDGSQLAFLRSAPPALRGPGSRASAPTSSRPATARSIRSSRSGSRRPGTLVGISRPAVGAPSLVLVSVAGDEQIPIATGPGARIAGHRGGRSVGTAARLPHRRTPTASSRRTSRTPTAATRWSITDFAPRTLVAAAVTVSG